MDEIRNLRQQWTASKEKKRKKIFAFSANQEASSTRAYLTKQIYTQLHVSSRNVFQFTSEFTSAFKCSYKCSLSNSNFNSNIVEFRFLDSSF